MKTLKIIRVIWLILAIAILQNCAYSARKSRKFLQKAFLEQYDLVIIPGAPFENGSWSNTVKARVYWAKYLYDKGIAKNLMFSGSAVYTPYVEGEIMAMYAKEIGIAEEHIFIETKAEHSVENVYYSYKKGLLLGFKTFAVASDPFQTKLLSKFVRKKVNPKMALIPIVFDTLKLLEPLMINPKIDAQKAFVSNFVSIKERESFRKRLRATRGKSLDTAGYK